MATTAGAPERLIPLREVAELLGVAEETLRYWRARGEGPASFVVGRRNVVYRSSAVAAYIAECEAREAERRDA